MATLMITHTQLHRASFRFGCIAEFSTDKFPHCGVMLVRNLSAACFGLHPNTHRSPGQAEKRTGPSD
jgi:hypothetical protein